MVVTRFKHLQLGSLSTSDTFSLQQCKDVKHIRRSGSEWVTFPLEHADPGPPPQWNRRYWSRLASEIPNDTLNSDMGD